MLRRSLAVVSFLSLLASVTAQQTATRKSGELFRNELDGFVSRLDGIATAAKPKRLPLGGDSVLANAQVLCAMGHAHRHYTIGDGPLVRPSLDFLLAKRDADGGYGDVTATGWVVEALQVMDPNGSAAQIAAGTARFEALGGKTLPWTASVEAVLANSAFPQDQGAPAQAKAKQLLADKDAPSLTEAAAAMVQLAACQVANKRLDQAAAKSAAPAAAPAAAVVASQPVTPVSAAELTAMRDRGVAWLFTQTKDGIVVTDGRPNLPLTAIGLMALQTKPEADRTPAERASLTAGLQWLLKQQNEDGTFGDTLANYCTCAAVGALRTFADPAVAPALQRAQRAILAFQNCEQNGYGPADRDYGSIGYGGMARGDLSNMNFAMQALAETGLPKENDALQRALVFLQRTQNRRASNDYRGQAAHPEQEGKVVEMVSGDDGGAGYYPGNSSAGYEQRPDGTMVPRSYGSMTYALLKCYALAGLKADDPRVASALDWLQKNWRLDANPGAGTELGANAAFQGLYYYYLLMAQALRAAGIERLQVAGAAVDWRAELRAHLHTVQQADGSWRNDQNGRWMESSRILCTSYALLAIAQ